MDLKELRRPFDESEIEWRIGQAGENAKGPWAKVLAYVTCRAIQDRLDDVCGPENWKNHYEKGPEGGVICGIGIRVNGEWVTKWDGAPNTDIESVKGGLSDSMKRAAVQWGIGRYLYGLDEGWAQIGAEGQYFATCKVKANGQEKFINFRWNPPRLPGWALPEEQEPAAEETTSAEWDKYASWVDKTYAKAIEAKEPWQSWDDIDHFVGHLFAVLEPAGLTYLVDGEMECDWKKLRNCHDPAVFKAICQALKEEAKGRMSVPF